MTEIESTTPEAEPTPPGGDPKELKLWSTLLHLSMLAGLIIPLGGLIVPVVIYILKKDELPGLEPHWNAVINWIISALIYFVICFILFIVVIGIFLMWALALVCLIYPIIGAIKANDGEVWPYPGSIQFFGRNG